MFNWSASVSIKSFFNLSIFVFLKWSFTQRNPAIIYSPSIYSKPVCISFYCRTQWNIFWRMLFHSIFFFLSQYYGSQWGLSAARLPISGPTLYQVALTRVLCTNIEINSLIQCTYCVHTCLRIVLVLKKYPHWITAVIYVITFAIILLTRPLHLKGIVQLEINFLYV